MKLRRWAIGLILMLGMLGWVGGEIPVRPPLATAAVLPTLNLNDFTGAIHPGCVGLHIAGSCTCTLIPETCVRVEYYQPIYAVTLVKQPDHQLLGHDVLAFMFGTQAAAEIAAQITTAFPLGGSGGTHEGVDGVRTHHFWDVRVYSVPPNLFQMSSSAGFSSSCLPCSQAESPGQLHYVSSLDPGWRSDAVAFPTPEQWTALPLGPMGIWGKLVPLSGFIVHTSAPTAAAAVATRAVHAVINPVYGKRVLTPGPPGAEFCFQPGWPTQKPCMPVGTHPALWEYNVLRGHQMALFFFWKKVSCCVDPVEAVCAEAIHAASGHQGEANFCRLFPGPPPGGLVPGLAPQIEGSGGQS